MNPERRIAKLEQDARHLTRSELQERLDRNLRPMTLPELQAIGDVVGHYMKTGQASPELVAVLEKVTRE